MLLLTHCASRADLILPQFTYSIDTFNIQVIAAAGPVALIYAFVLSVAYTSLFHSAGPTLRFYRHNQASTMLLLHGKLSPD